jgi:NAD+ diphosphatase
MLKKILETPPQAMAFTGNTLDRQANRRGDAHWLTGVREASSSRCILLSDDKVALTETGGLAFASNVPETAILLGLDHDGAAWFADEADHVSHPMDLRGLAASGLLPSQHLDLLAQARALLHWHKRHGFCANCGHATDLSDAGYKRSCPACKAEHFPRTDPVIIIAVTHGKRVLLGRQASWPAGMYSTLAGFMEPGETIEDAARREVKEESGVDVGEISIAANQPWPFPSSLMIGLVGEALTDEIVIDEKEIEHARWFTHDDIAQMLNATHPEGCKIPPPLAIAHHLILKAIEDRHGAK